MVYSFGNNAYSQLGQGGTNPHVTPSPIVSLPSKRILHVETGAYHTVVATDDGEVYTCGWTGNGQLGHSRSTPLFSLVNGLPSTIEVTQVIGGYSHTLVLSESHGVFSFGSNSHGQLGHGNFNNVATPKVIDALNSVNVVKATAGDYHSLFLADDGVVYTCGNNSSGQLGLGNNEHVTTPTKIALMLHETVVGMAAGGCGTLLLTEKGQVFSMGIGTHGQMGHGNTEDIKEPRLIQALADMKAIYIASGGCHSVVLMDTGAVYTFGQGVHGQLGTGDTSNRNKPFKIEGSETLGIVQIDAGYKHTLMLTDEGTIYACGYGGDGQLGFATTTELVPKMVVGLEDVVDISANGSHSIIIKGECSQAIYREEMLGLMSHPVLKLCNLTSKQF